MKYDDQLELDFEYIDTDLPAAGKLRRIEKQLIDPDGGTPRDTWIVVEKFTANGRRFLSADNQFYYLEKLL